MGVGIAVEVERMDRLVCVAGGTGVSGLDGKSDWGMQATNETRIRIHRPERFINTFNFPPHMLQ